MNKTFHFIRNLRIRIIVFLAVCAVLYSLSIQPARADAAPPPDPTVGGAAPYRPIETKVQMMSETVLIDALPSQTRWATPPDYYWTPNQINVSASFTMQNQGDTEEKMYVLFPLTRLDMPWDESSYNIIHSSFVARVDGNLVPTTETTTPPELGKIPQDWRSVDTPDGIFPGDVKWAAFAVTFPVHQDVLIQVGYLMDGGDQGLHQVDYILETGAGWYGNILSADITVRLPYPATLESVPEASPGYSFSGNDVHWKMINFEPKRKDNLSVRFIDTNAWPPILELRSRVEQFPEDADAWYKLADKYSELGFWDSPGGLMIDNQHLVDLSIEASQKAIYFRPEWGDAHYQLAGLLWDDNPKVGMRPEDYYKHRGKPALKDPAVQRVIQEVKLAQSYGITGDYPWYFVELLNKTFPGLNLPVPSRVSAQSSPTPTQTPEPVTGTAQMAVSMAAGNDRTCVLTLGGEVKCEGYFTDQRIDMVGNIKAVAAGDGYICLLFEDGSVKCNGQNDFGQLGDGSTTDRATFVDVEGLTSGVAELVAGDHHTCALIIGGRIKCWGRNYFGQLGNGATAYSLIPVDVTGLADGVTSLVAGNDHTCVLLSAGGVKCWGANESGQLGDGSRINRLEPVDVVGLPNDVTALAAGLTHTCALTQLGKVQCWGDNTLGQFDESMILNHSQPIDVPGLGNDIRAVVAGDRYTCVLTTEASVQCWGRNNFGQLGDGTTTDRPIPYDVVGLSSGVISLVAGNNHTCALLQDGEVKCWGMLEFGEEVVKSADGGWPIFVSTPIIAVKLGIQLSSTPTPVPTATPWPPFQTPVP